MKIQNINDAKPLDIVTIIDSRGIERDQKLWPTHCVAETQGSSIYHELKLPEDSVPIYKGTISDVESYSVFGDPNGIEDTGLNARLREDDIKTVIFCGIAFDVCVASSLMDAIKLGYRVILIEDACVGISLEGIKASRKAMLEAGVHITTTAKVSEIVNGKFVPLQHIIQQLKPNLPVATNGVK